jgi:hypothetical protein
MHALWHSFADWWLWHPMREGRGSTCSATDHSGCGYAGWSGWMGSVLWSLPGWAALGFGLLRAKNCHVHRCWRLSWHEHPDHGHPVCRVHHPDGYRGWLWRLLHGERRDPSHVLAPERH